MKVFLMSLMAGTLMATAGYSQSSGEQDSTRVSVIQTTNIRNFDIACDIPHRNQSGDVEAYSRVWIDTNYNFRLSGKSKSPSNYRVTISSPRAARHEPAGHTDANGQIIYGLEMEVVDIEVNSKSGVCAQSQDICTSIKVVGIASMEPSEILFIDDLNGNTSIASIWFDGTVKCESN